MLPPGSCVERESGSGTDTLMSFVIVTKHLSQLTNLVKSNVIGKSMQAMSISDPHAERDELESNKRCECLVD
jgi:hypothetical protein